MRVTLNRAPNVPEVARLVHQTSARKSPLPQPLSPKEVVRFLSCVITGCCALPPLPLGEVGLSGPGEGSLDEHIAIQKTPSRPLPRPTSPAARWRWQNRTTWEREVGARRRTAIYNFSLVLNSHDTKFLHRVANLLVPVFDRVVKLRRDVR
jgi:hypothetical protein